MGSSPSLRNCVGNAIFRFLSTNKSGVSRSFWSAFVLLCASFLSYQAMADNNSLASATVLVIVPTWSSDEAIDCIQYLDTLPYVGFNPTTPHSAAG